MKKLFFLLFSASILCSYNAKAQSAATPAGTSSNFTITPAMGGEWNVIIVVTDAKGSPVSGAKVNLPCSGQTFEFTDSKGTVDFIGSGSCPCTSSNANVQTSRSNVNQAVSCGTNYVSLPQ